jgi:hypothetical protein
VSTRPSFSPVFSESAVFFTYAYFGLVLFLPFSKHLTWERWHGILLIMFLIIFIPHFIYANDTDYSYYYQSLFIDPTIGLLGGYLFYQVRENPYQDYFSILLLSVSICGITLMKDSGIIFAALCLGTSIKWFITLLRVKKQRKAAVHILIPVLLLSFTYLSWKYLLGVYAVSNHIPMGTPSLISLWLTFKQFFITSVVLNLGIALSSISYGGILIIMTAVYALYIYRDRALFTADRWVLISRFIVYIGFIVGYVSLFNTYIAKHELLSFSRYMGTLILCETYIFAYMLIDKFHQTGKTFVNKTYRNLTSFEKLLVAVFSVLIVIFSAYTIHNFRKVEAPIYEPAQVAAENLADNISENRTPEHISNIYLLIGGDTLSNSLLHHRIYFDLIDKNIRIKNFYTETDITQDGLGYTPKRFLELLKDQEFEYVYILNADNGIMNEFNDIFPSLAADQSKSFLYRVVIIDDSVTLQYMP